MTGLHHSVDGIRIQFLLHSMEDSGTGLGILQSVVVLEREVDTLCQGIQGAVRQLRVQLLRKLPGAVVPQFRQLYSIFVQSPLQHTKIEACVVGHHDIITYKSEHIGPDVGKGGRVFHILGMNAMNRYIERIKAHLRRGDQGVELVQNLVPVKAHHSQCAGAGFGAVGCLEI